MRKKLFTLMTLLLTAVTGVWAQTSGTDVLDETGVTKDNDLSGTAVVLPGTYIAGQGNTIKGYSPSNKGIKLRTKAAKVTVNEVDYGYVVLTTKPNCTLKSIKLEGTSNNAETTISLKGVYVDMDTENLATSIEGATNKLAADVEFPVNSTNYVGTDNVSINATSNVVLLFDDTSYSQMCAIFTVGYEKAADTKVATPTFLPVKDDFATSSLDVTLACETEGAAIQYSTNGIDYTDYTSAINITETTTIYAKATKAGLTDSDVASKTYTKTAVVDVFDASAQNATFVLTKANITSAANAFITASADKWNTDKTFGGYSGDFYNMSKTDRNLTMKVSGASTFEVYVQNTNANRTYTIKVGNGEAKTITHGGTGVESSGVIATGTTNEVTIVLAGGGESVYPVYIKFNPTTTISHTKRTTSFSSSQALNFAGSDLTAYAVSALSASSVTLTAVPDVPASTGLILIGETGDKDVLLGTATTLATTNKLHASVDATDVAANSTYVVSDGKICLFTGTVIPAGKAYLLKTDVDAVGGGSATPSPELNIVFGDENSDMTTGISNVEAQKGFLDGEFYNLNGQRVSQPAKGLYIVNGRKVVIK